MSSQITTLEKQFGFTSAQSGFLMSCNDIGFLLTTIFVANLARTLHIPRSLFVSTFCFGLSGVFCSLAYFLSPVANTDQPITSNMSSQNTFFNSDDRSKPGQDRGSNEVHPHRHCDNCRWDDNSGVREGPQTTLHNYLYRRQCAQTEDSMFHWYVINTHPTLLYQKYNQSKT